jgi:hypothetical protein
MKKLLSSKGGARVLSEWREGSMHGERRAGHYALAKILHFDSGDFCGDYGCKSVFNSSSSGFPLLNFAQSIYPSPYAPSSFSSALASFKSAVSKPSVNQL